MNENLEKLASLQTEFDRLKETIFILYGSYGKGALRSSDQKVQSLLATHASLMKEYDDTLKKNAEIREKINRGEINAVACDEVQATIDKLTEINLGLANKLAMSANKAAIFQKRILFLKHEHLPLLKKEMAHGLSEIVNPAFRIQLEELAPTIQDIEKSLYKKIKSTDLETLDDLDLSLDKNLMSLIKKAEKQCSSIDSHVKTIRDIKNNRIVADEALCVQNMISLLDQEIKDIAARHNSITDPRIHFLNGVKNALQIHYSDYEFAKVPEKDTIEDFEKENRFNLMTNSLGEIANRLKNKQLHALTISSPFIAFISKLLQPINTLIKKGKKQVFRAQIFSGKTEKTIAKKMEKMTKNLEEIAKDMELDVQRSKSGSQTLIEQFENSSIKADFIIYDYLLDATFYKQLCGLEKEKREKIAQEIVYNREDYDFEKLIIKLSDLCFAAKKTTFQHEDSRDFLSSILLELVRQTSKTMNSASDDLKNYQFNKEEEVERIFSLIKEVAERHGEQNFFLSRIPGCDQKDKQFIKNYLDRHEKLYYEACQQAIQSIKNFINEFRQVEQKKKISFFAEADLAGINHISRVIENYEKAPANLFYQAIYQAAKNVSSWSKEEKLVLFYKNILSNTYLLPMPSAFDKDLSSTPALGA